MTTLDLDTLAVAAGWNLGDPVQRAELDAIAEAAAHPDPATDAAALLLLPRVRGYGGGHVLVDLEPLALLPVWRFAALLRALAERLEA